MRKDSEEYKLKKYGNKSALFHYTGAVWFEYKYEQPEW
jgi:hypothetical protein